LTQFRDVVSSSHDEHVGELLAEVHGDSQMVQKGAQRQTYEVLSFCYEITRYGNPLHPYHEVRVQRTFI